MWQEALVVWGCFSFRSIFDMYLSYSHLPCKTSIFIQYSEVFVFSTTNTWSQALGHNLPFSLRPTPPPHSIRLYKAQCQQKYLFTNKGLQENSISSSNKPLKRAPGFVLGILVNDMDPWQQLYRRLLSFHLSSYLAFAVSFHLLIKARRSLD